MSLGSQSESMSPKYALFELQALIIVGHVYVLHQSVYTQYMSTSSDTCTVCGLVCNSINN